MCKGVSFVDFTERLKKLYEDSDKLVIMADEKMQIVWSNQPQKSRMLDLGRLRVYEGKKITLPVEAAVTAEYPGDFGESCAVEVQPVGDGEGYMLTFYSCDDIERLADRSGHLKFKANFLGNIRNELSQVLFTLEAKRQKYLEQGDMDFLNFEKEARYRILRTFSATVNYNEISKYYNGFFSKEPVCISDVVRDLCVELEQQFADGGCELTFDIEPDICLMSNEDRIKAAVCNLLINAFMYCGAEKKKCRLELSVDGEDILLSVSDNGGSITAAELEKCRTPFAAFRKFGERESLGIAVVSMFCGSQGGSLGFECKQGEYTKAVMRIPRGEDVSGELRAERRSRLKSPYDVPGCIIAKGLDPLKYNL